MILINLMLDETVRLCLCTAQRYCIGHATGRDFPTAQASFSPPGSRLVAASAVSSQDAPVTWHPSCIAESCSSAVQLCCNHFLPCINTLVLPLSSLAGAGAGATKCPLLPLTTPQALQTSHRTTHVPPSMRDWTGEASRWMVLAAD
jgi:hypothetical protein